jgi:hypothetical protein
LEDECSEWLGECLKVFPKLGKYVVTARYYRMSKKVLSRIKMYVTGLKDIDVEALLLRGESKSETKVDLSEFYEIQINSKLREIENAEVRKQIVQHTMIHDLLYAERKDLKTPGKNKKAKQKEAYEEEFEEELFQRFNKLRELNGLPAIKKREDFDIAFSKVLTKLDEKTSRHAKKPKTSRDKG